MNYLKVVGMAMEPRYKWEKSKCETMAYKRAYIFEWQHCNAGHPSPLNYLACQSLISSSPR